MLGATPTDRRHEGTVARSQIYNILLQTPFVVAFWIITENQIGSVNDGVQCGGIPLNVANFARWAFLGFAAYQLFTFPLNMIAARKRRQDLAKREAIVTKRIEHNSYGTVNTETRVEDRKEVLDNYVDRTRLIDWLRMGDALYWLSNWALWFYIVAACANGDQCNYGPLKHLLNATMWVSVGFAIAGIIIGLYFLIKYLAYLAHEIKEEAEFRIATNQTRSQHGGAVLATNHNVGSHPHDQYIANQDRVTRTDDIHRTAVSTSIASRVIDKAEQIMDRADAHLAKKDAPENRTEHAVNIGDGARDEVTRHGRGNRNFSQN